MERNKIVAVAALAVIVTWRVSAMEQEQKIILVTKDGEKTPLSKNRALLFGTVKDLLADMNEASQEAPSFEVPIEKILTKKALQMVVNDLDWALDVRSQIGAGETQYQAAEKKARKKPPTAFTIDAFKASITCMEIAHHLHQPELLTRYACESEAMLTSDTALGLLYKENPSFMTVLNNLTNGAKAAMYRCFYHQKWILHCKVPHDESAIGADGLLGTFSRDGQKVLTCSNDHMAVLWHTDTCKPFAQCRHQCLVQPGIFCPDGTAMVMAIKNEAKVYTILANRVQAAFAMQHQNKVTSALYSNDGMRIVTAAGNQGQIWDARGGRPIGEPIEHRDPLCNAIFSPDSTLAMTASNDAIHISDALKGTHVRVWNQPDGGVKLAVFCPNGSKVGISLVHKTLKVVNANTGEAFFEPIQHDGLVVPEIFSPDGTRLVAISGSTAHIVNAHNGAIIKSITHEKPVCIAIFGPKGDQVVTISGSGADSKISTFDAQSGIPSAKSIAHAETICSASLSSDGMKLLTTDKGVIGTIWDLLLIRTFDQALLIQLLEWAKKNKWGRPQSEWFDAVMETFEPAEQEGLKNMCYRGNNSKCAIS